jgi:hypothetical protein
MKILIMLTSLLSALSCQTTNDTPTSSGEIITDPDAIARIDAPVSREKKQIANEGEEELTVIRDIDFRSIIKGSIPEKYHSLYEGKSFLVIESLENLMNFKAKSNVLNSEEASVQLETLDFSDSYILVLLNGYTGPAIYRHTIKASYNKNFNFIVETASEGMGCNDVVKGKISGITFEVLNLKKITAKPQEETIEFKVANKTHFCSESFGNFSVLEEARDLPFSLERQLTVKGHLNKEMISHRVFRNRWGAWEGYVKNVCRDCSEDESLKDYTKNKVLLALDLSSVQEDDQLIRNYHLRIKNIKYLGGYWYVNTYRDAICPGEEPLNHLLVSVLKQDIPGDVVTISNDKIVLPSPFLPISKRSCL